MKNLRRILGWIAVCIFAIGQLVYLTMFCCVFFLVLMFEVGPWIAGEGDVCQTQDIADYGVIEGNYDNDTPREFIQSFFPEEIEVWYSDVEYYYWAKKMDTYSYEAYLEFEVPDKALYTRLVDEVTEGAELPVFEYDSQYREYTVSDELEIWFSGMSEEWKAEYAQIGKVLFSDKTQSVIYVAIGTYDGGATDISELDHFFSRFGIDPVEYATRIYD